MSVILSSHDLANLHKVVAILISPLSASSVNQWRSDACNALRQLMNANTTGFILPVCDGPFVYSDDHDIDALNAFPEILPPPTSSGKSGFQVGCELGVTTIEQAWGPTPEDYFGSAYYNEYAKPNGAADTLGVMLATDPESPLGFAALQVWHEERGRLTERDVALGQLIYPAFKAGVETQLTLGAQKDSLLRAFDQLGQGMAIVNHAGRIQHQTSTLTAMTTSDPESPVLTAAIVRCAHAALHLRADSNADLAQTVSTSTSTYAVRASIAHGLTSTTAPCAIVSVTRVDRREYCEGELQKRFGLTAAESKVALLIARGFSNRAIANELSSSPHTIRRHTEKVFAKLNVNSRAKLAALLHK